MSAMLNFLSVEGSSNPFVAANIKVNDAKGIFQMIAIKAS